MNPGSGADLRYAGDKRSDTDEKQPGKRYRQNKKDAEKYRGKKAKQKKRMTSSTRMKAGPMVTATINTAGKRIEAYAAKQRSTAECADKIRTPGRMGPPGTCLPYYQSVQIS